MNEKLPPIPTPPSLKWREFRINFMPVAVFGVAVCAAIVIWKTHVSTPSLVGEVEHVQSVVVSSQNGLILELLVDRFSRVRKGDAIAEIRTADPESIRASLEEITTDLKVLETRMAQDEQRLAQDYEQLRLNWLQERVALATARVDAQYAESEFNRTSELFQNQLVSENEFELARNLMESSRAEVAERQSLVESIEEGLQRIDLKNDVNKTYDVTESIAAAIAAREKLLVEQQGSVTLRAPINGTVTAVYKFQGERVLEGDMIATISATDSQRIVGYLRQPVTMMPAPGDPVEVRSRSSRGKVAMAKVIRVGDQFNPIEPRLLTAGMDPNQMGLPLVVSLPPELQLLPGELVDLSIAR